MTRSNSYLFLVFASLLLGATGFAADTNVCYLPYDRGSIVAARANPEQIEAARHLPECRAAELDPDGHWGEIAAGLQLGIRLPKTEFHAGESIEITGILRNTTTNAVWVPFANMDLIKWFRFKDGKPVPIGLWGPWLFGSRGRSMLRWSPLSQMKHSPHDLTGDFKRSAPGVYRVFAQCQKSQLAPELPEIQSGIAEITLLPPASK